MIKKCEDFVRNILRQLPRIRLYHLPIYSEWLHSTISAVVTNTTAEKCQIFTDISEIVHPANKKERKRDSTDISSSNYRRMSPVNNALFYQATFVFRGTISLLKLVQTLKFSIRKILVSHLTHKLFYFYFSAARRMSSLRSWQ